MNGSTRSRAVRAAFLALVVAPARAQSPEDAGAARPVGALRFLDRALQPGARVSVKGPQLPDGPLRADEIQLVAGDDRDIELEGPVEALDSARQTLTVLGQVVQTRAKTEYSREPEGPAAFADLRPGLRVKLDVERTRDGGLRADEIRIRDPSARGRAKVEGRLARVAPSARGVAELDVAGFTVVLFEDTVLIGTNGRERPAFRGRLGVVDEDDVLFTRPNRLGRHVAYAGEVRLRSERLADLDLDPGTDDDELTAEVGGTLAFAADLGPVFAYATVVAAREFILDSASPFADGASDARIGEAYVQVSPAPGIGVAVGRQAFNEEREWHYNTRNLDAVRLRADFYPLTVEASASRDVFDQTRNVRDRDLTNVIIRAHYELAHELDLEGHLIDRDDRSDHGDSPSIVGLRLLGHPTPNIELWAEAAHLGGTVCERVRIAAGGAPFDSGRPCSHTEPPDQFVVRDASGRAADFGMTWRPRAKLDPTLTLGYAWGSGEGDEVRGLTVEEASLTTARSFHQSGLQRNRWKYNGVVSFRYYGEVLDPALTNIGVLTLGLGFRPLRPLSIDLIYHDYRQDRPSRAFHEFEIDDTPSGSSADLGDAWDLIVGYEPTRLVELRLTSGLFNPGDAFGAGAKRAAAVRFQAKFRF